MTEQTKKLGSRLAEKAQHLDPLKGVNVSRVGASAAASDTARRTTNAPVVVQSSSSSSSSDGACSNSPTQEDCDTLPPIEKVQDNPAHCSSHGNFKLGADSVDLEDASAFVKSADGAVSVNADPDNGFLSPTSPVSPTSPTSVDSLDIDGQKRTLKSSMRDPNRPKTPPGTPCRKSVRFADALGLDLETVKTILRTESPPDLPQLNVHVDEDKQTISAKVLSLCFQQPGGKPDFMRRLYNQNVCLENIVVHEFTLIGTIKVRNLGFEKDVRIRHSSDNWNSYVDQMAMYVAGSCDGPTDRFSFGLSGPRSMAPGNILSFAIYYKVAGDIFWDNNGGENYSLVCEEVKKG